MDTQYVGSDNSADLEHHGVQGMHWYQRRYQNSDGSLTELGREHYGVGPPRGSRKSFQKVAYKSQEDAEAGRSIDGKKDKNGKKTVYKGRETIGSSEGAEALKQVVREARREVSRNIRNGVKSAGRSALMSVKRKIPITMTDEERLAEINRLRMLAAYKEAKRAAKKGGRVAETAKDLLESGARTFVAQEWSNVARRMSDTYDRKHHLGMYNTYVKPETGDRMRYEMALKILADPSKYSGRDFREAAAVVRNAQTVESLGADQMTYKQAMRILSNPDSASSKELKEAATIATSYKTLDSVRDKGMSYTQAMEILADPSKASASQIKQAGETAKSFTTIVAMANNVDTRVERLRQAAEQANKDETAKEKEKEKQSEQEKAEADFRAELAERERLGREGFAWLQEHARQPFGDSGPLNPLPGEGSGTPVDWPDWRTR